jgi:anti-anti-sigma factor
MANLGQEIIENHSSIQARIIDGITILIITGTNIIGEIPELLEQKADEAITNGNCNIIIDLSQAFLMDSTGLGKIIAIHVKTFRAGGCLKLSGTLNNNISNLLKITRVIDLVDHYPNYRSALNSFKK